MWKTLNDEERQAIVNRKLAGESITLLAEELDMHPLTLDRRIREFRQIKETGKNTVWKSTNRKPKKDVPRVELRSAVFDIETTDFSAGGFNAHLVCMCILPLDSDEVITHQIEFEDERDDRRVLQEAVDHLCEFDIIIGHYITGFDLPYLNSRLIYHGLAQLQKRFIVYDTYQAARRMNLKSDRKSLAFLGDFFQLKNRKTSIYPVSWSHIDSNEEDDFFEARQQIVDHCVGDVIMNRELFSMLWERDRSMASLPVYKK
jgi:hypothetical protein